MAQVFGQSAADIRRKREPLVTIALAAHADRAHAPVDVVEPEPGDFAAPKAEPDQQGQDRQIAATNGGVDIAGREQAPHLIGLEPLGQTGQPTAEHLGCSVNERSLRDAIEM